MYNNNGFSLIFVRVIAFLKYLIGKYYGMKKDR